MGSNPTGCTPLPQNLRRTIDPGALRWRLTLAPGGASLVSGSSGNTKPGHPGTSRLQLDAGVEVLSQTGAKVVLFTGPDWESMPVLGRNRADVAIFNEHIHAITSRLGAVITHLGALRQLRERLMWDPNRLHLSPLGHHTVGMMVLNALNVPQTFRPLDPKDLPESRWRQARPGPEIFCGSGNTSSLGC